jgi:hypothetical protein
LGPDPWGDRTPYGPLDEWPERLDVQLAPCLEPSDVDAWARSASVLHSNGDAIDIAVKDGRIGGAAPATASTTGGSIPRIGSAGRRTTRRTA